MRMGNKQRWNSFIPQLANKLTEAHGDQWPDDVKISLLKGTLNYTLRSALANNHLLLLIIILSGYELSDRFPSNMMSWQMQASLIT